MTQILVGGSAVISETFAPAGTPTDLDSSAVPAVTITRPDGTPGPASGPVTHVGAAGSGTYQFTLAAQPTPIILTITWAGLIGGQLQTLTSRIEVVGALLFTTDGLREMRVAGTYPFADNAIPHISDAHILEVRAACLEEMTHHLNFSPVPRFARETVDGGGTGQVILVDPGLLCRTPPLSVTINGVAQSTGSYTLSHSGILRATSGYVTSGVFSAGWGNVTVEYVHGWDRPRGLAGAAAMLWAAAQLNPSGFSSATTVSLPTGETYSYEPSYSGREGFKRFTGVVALDRWLNSHRAPVAV